MAWHPMEHALGIMQQSRQGMENAAPQYRPQDMQVQVHVHLHDYGSRTALQPHNTALSLAMCPAKWMLLATAQIAGFA